jgi:1-acyl-sn-glycerol-3-phosphate acyltransferase
MDLQTFRRRALSVMVYGLGLVALTVLSPVVLPVAAVVDTIRRARLVRSRLYLFFWSYLAHQFAGLGVMVWLFLRYRPADPRYVEGHYRLQRWWCWSQLQVGKRLMGFRFEVEGQECVEQGPVLVFLRHTSFVDVLFGECFAARPGQLRLRYVLKRELRADPCLDVFMSRLPNCFVNRRGDSEAERQRVRQLAEGIGAGDAVLIYPEGTRYLPETLAKIKRKFKETKPELYPYCAELKNVLPPRLGGPFALLDGAPDADVVFVTYSGLDGFDTAKSMLSGEVVGQTVRMRMWRVPSHEIPRDFDERVEWLYTHWTRVGVLAAAE